MRIAACLLSAFLASLAFGQDHFRFVVTGDGRWDTSGGRPADDVNGVNVKGMTRVVDAILKEKPAVLLFTGDTVGGAKTDAEESSQYDTWMKVMQPTYDAGIHVLVVRGNHEMHCEHPDDLWRKVFSGQHANPQDGPDTEKDLTYSYAYGNSLFIALDQFQTKDPVINQDWLDKTLAGNKKMHIFPFAHKMAFRVAHHVDGMDTVPAARDKFFDSLENAGCRTYFCGHDHLYDHAVISKSGWADSKAINQFVVGTAGAPFVSGTDHGGQNTDWNVKTVSHDEGHLGYCVVDIDGPKVTVVYKAEKTPGDFEPVETYSYNEDATSGK